MPDHPILHVVPSTPSAGPEPPVRDGREVLLEWVLALDQLRADLVLHRAALRGLVHEAVELHVPPDEFIAHLAPVLDGLLDLGTRLGELGDQVRSRSAPAAETPDEEAR